MKVEIYTSIAGDNDSKRKDKIHNFTNFSKFKRDVYNSRIHKILPHLLFPDVDATVWIDGNIYLREGIDVEEMVKELLGDNDIVLFKHPTRDCLYQEAIVCKNLYIDRVKDEVDKAIDEQIYFYEFNKFPNHFGLWETGVMIRRNNDKMKQFNEKWWSHISMFSNRDQLSFPYVVKELPDVKIGLITGNVRTHPYFKIYNHTRIKQ